MRNTILLFVGIVLMSGGVLAQDVQKLTLEKTYKIENSTAEDIYIRAFDWVTTIFNNPGYNLKSEKHEPGLVEATGIFSIEKFLVEASLKFEIKNNTCTVSIFEMSDESQEVQDYMNRILDRMEGVLSSRMSDQVKNDIKKKM